MLNQAICAKCGKEGFNIKLDYIAKEMWITCMNCGEIETLTNLFKLRRQKSSRNKLDKVKEKLTEELENVSEERTTT